MSKIKAQEIAGLDLAALENRQSGYASARGTKILYSDDEIIHEIRKQGIKLVAIDAPLSMPRKYHYRDCDIAIRKAGIKIFSFNLPALRLLAKRGKRLKRKLGKLGIETIETYPHAVMKLSTRASKVFHATNGTKHERDAVVCRLVALAYAKGKAVAFGTRHIIWVV